MRRCKHPQSYSPGLSGALQLTVQPRTTSQAYLLAQYTDVLCGIEVGIPCPATGRIVARKPFALAGADIQAAVAHLGGIRRRHQVQHDTRALRFVGYELPELVAGPTVTPTPFGLGSWLGVGAFTNARQVFQGQCRLLALGGVHQGLGITWLVCRWKRLSRPDSRARS
jgi:hypothetical protein